MKRLGDYLPDTMKVLTVIAFALSLAWIAHIAWGWSDWEKEMRSKDRALYNACHTRCYPNTVSEYYADCVCDTTKVIR